MQLTEQQRAELEQRGWRVKWRTGSFETWEHPAYSVGVHVWANGEIGAMGNIGEALEFAAAVGYAPPGYRLVPEEVAERGLRHIASVRREAQNYLDVCEVRADEPDQSDETKETWARIVEEARQSLAEIDALASALQGEVEKR